MSKSHKNKKENGSWFQTKKLFFGVGKEFRRISWPSLKHILWGFVIVFILTAVLVLVFYIVSDIMVASHIINTVKSSSSSSSTSTV